MKPDYQTVLEGLAMPIGPPACGKTFLRQQFRQLGYSIVCRDDLRRQLTGEASNLNQEARVTRMATFFLNTAYEAGMPVYLDATNLNRSYRIEELERASTAGVPKVALLREQMSLEALRLRNISRPRQVPFEVIEKMYRTWIGFTPEQLMEEGFDQVVVWGDSTIFSTHPSPVRAASG